MVCTCRRFFFLLVSEILCGFHVIEVPKCFCWNSIDHSIGLDSKIVAIFDISNEYAVQSQLENNTNSSANVLTDFTHSTNKVCRCSTQAKYFKVFWTHFLLPLSFFVRAMFGNLQCKNYEQEDELYSQLAIKAKLIRFDNMTFLHSLSY